jgi:hypothetical protein
MFRSIIGVLPLAKGQNHALTLALDDRRVIGPTISILVTRFYHKAAAQLLAVESFSRSSPDRVGENELIFAS